MARSNNIAVQFTVTKSCDTKCGTHRFSDMTERQPRKVRRWRVPAECSRHRQHRLEKLGRRR